MFSPPDLCCLPLGRIPSPSVLFRLGGPPSRGLGSCRAVPSTRSWNLVGATGCFPVDGTPGPGVLVTLLGLKAAWRPAFLTSTTAEAALCISWGSQRGCPVYLRGALAAFFRPVRALVVAGHSGHHGVLLGRPEGCHHWAISSSSCLGSSCFPYFQLAEVLARSWGSPHSLQES